MPRWFIALALFGAGCVSRGSHELVEVQLEATRTAMGARAVACQSEVEARDARIAELEAALNGQTVALAAEAQRCLVLDEELEQHRAEIVEHVVREGEVDVPAAEVRDALAVMTKVRLEERARQVFADDVARRFAPLIAEGKLTFVSEPGRVAVRVPADLLFNEGRTTVSPRGEVLIDGIANAIAPAAGWRIQVQGHTDAVARHTAEHPSNWELGYDYAVTVMRHLEESGVKARMSVATFAGTVPLAGNDTAEGRKANRRVELVFRAPVPPSEPIVEPEQVPEQPEQ